MITLIFTIIDNINIYKNLQNLIYKGNRDQMGYILGNS
jgi:hypothetical protein